MITHGNEIELFSGNSNKPLAEAIAKELKIGLSGLEVGTFSDGEISVHLCETVRGKDVFLIQSTSAPVNNNLMELLIMIDAARRASASRGARSSGRAWRRVTARLRPCPPPRRAGRPRRR